MIYRTLGRTGVKVSPLALGADNFANPTPEAESITIIERALEVGINLIDTSNSYASGESERIIGRALAANGRRHELLIATKAHYPVGPGPNERGNSRLHLIKACEDSLRRSTSPEPRFARHAFKGRHFPGRKYEQLHCWSDESLRFAILSSYGRTWPRLMTNIINLLSDAYCKRDHDRGISLIVCCEKFFFLGYLPISQFVTNFEWMCY